MDYIAHIDDSLIDRVEKGFSRQYGYQEFIIDTNNPDRDLIPNPQPKKEFINQKLTKFLLDSVTANEVNLAVDQARQLALQTAISLDVVIKPIF